MATTGLEVRIHEGRERAEVSRVTTTLNDVVLSLREIDRVHLLRATRATWVMADMRRESADLVVRLEARAEVLQRGLADIMVPVNALVEGVKELQAQASVPPLFAPQTVSRVGKLAVPRNGIQTVGLATYNGKVGPNVALDNNVKTNADIAVKPFEVTWGTVTGRLTSLHDYSKRRQGTFRVTLRTPEGNAVYGYVQEAMSEVVRGAWAHRVMCGGKLKRNSRGQAIAIEVESIELMPEDDRGRPRSDDLLGVAAGWLGDLTVEQFIDGLRDA